jgi:hypothetical protein
MNLLYDDGWPDRTWPPMQPGFEWRRKRVSGDHLGASVYALPPGQTTFPSSLDAAAEHFEGEAPGQR